MRIESVKLNKQTMHLPRKFLPLVWFILQRPPFFTRKNGRIGTASDSLGQGIPCGRNTSNSFIAILLKLHWCFGNGLKIYM